MLRGVLFDLDDTLADSRGTEERVWLDIVELIAAHHPGVDRARLRERYVGVLESHYVDHAAGITDFLTYRRRRLEDALEPWGAVDDDLFERYVAIKERCVEEIEPAPGAVALLRRLRGAGMRVGILTNGPGPMQRRKLEVCALGDEVDCVAISGELGHAKPAPEAFAAALALLGTAPDETAMIGDSLVNDVEGACAAGLPLVVWLREDGEPPRGAVGARTLAEVAALLGFG